jgi:hypothetical protein
MTGDPERRRQLRKLDELLDQLEQLNLHEQTQVPIRLTRRLQDLGIRDWAGASVNELIERVLNLQEPLLFTERPDSRSEAV